MATHGSNNTYKNGCRCEACRDAHKQGERARRAARLHMGEVTHGKRATYDLGCRCDECRTARLLAYVTRERRSDQPYKGSLGGAA